MNKISHQSLIKKSIDRMQLHKNNNLYILGLFLFFIGILDLADIYQSLIKL